LKGKPLACRIRGTVAKDSALQQIQNCYRVYDFADSFELHQRWKKSKLASIITSDPVTYKT